MCTIELAPVLMYCDQFFLSYFILYVRPKFLVALFALFQSFFSSVVIHRLNFAGISLESVFLSGVIYSIVEGSKVLSITKRFS